MFACRNTFDEVMASMEHPQMFKISEVTKQGREFSGINNILWLKLAHIAQLARLSHSRLP